MSRVLEDLVGNMSVGELARLSGSTVEQLVAKVLGQVVVAPRASGALAGPATPSAAITSDKAAPSRPKKLPKGGLSTADVLAVLAAAQGSVTAQDVRAKLGGTGNQVRAALAKLHAAGKVKITGERRGTRYAAK